MRKFPCPTLAKCDIDNNKPRMSGRQPKFPMKITTENKLLNKTKSAFVSPYFD